MLQSHGQCSNTEAGQIWVSVKKRVNLATSRFRRATGKFRREKESRQQEEKVRHMKGLDAEEQATHSGGICNFT